jgi:hypothetical protein
MANLNEILAEVQKLPEVYSAKIWEDRRIYINITGAKKDFAGDRNAKIFYDAKTERWHIEGLKGTMSSEFGANIRKFAETRCRSAFWRD